MRRLAAVLLLVAGCRGIEPAKTAEGALVEVDPADFPAFSDDLDSADLDAAIAQSRTYYARIAQADPTRTSTFDREKVPIAQLVATLDRFEALVASRPPPDQLRDRILRDFRLFRSTGATRDGEVLFTGYYLPELRGSLVKASPFEYPLYAAPPDIVTARARDFPQLKGADLVGRMVGNELKPYATRTEIRQGALANKGLELVWVDSAIDAFFLEIQGSGVVKLVDGSSRVVTFAGKNGHPYVAIGAELIRRGAIPREQVSMQTIRAWLDANPAEREALMDLNPSYVFFREGPAPVGSINVPVTPGRTIATDTRVFPKGALAFIETERPEDATSEKMRKYSRFVLDQDTGGAIRTAAHVDTYWGSGDYAANAAGRMKQPGHLYYLLAR